MAYFKFNGIRSDEMGLFLINSVEHETTTNDIETIEVPGRNDVLLKDNHRLKEVYRSYPCRVKANGSDIPTLSSEISAWLNVKGWQDLELSWDPEHIYKATFINKLSVEEILRTFGKVKIDLMLKSIKFKKDAFTKKTVTNGQNIINRGNVEANPIIEISGTGDIILSINGRNTYIKALQDTLIIDRQLKTVKNGALAGWEYIERRADSQWPILDVGNNAISWTGDVTSVNIQTGEGVML